MALGAGKNETLGLVLREVSTIGLIGMAAGLPLACTPPGIFHRFLFGVPAWDAPTFVGAAYSAKQRF